MTVHWRQRPQPLVEASECCDIPYYSTCPFVGQGGQAENPWCRHHYWVVHRRRLNLFDRSCCKCRCCFRNCKHRCRHFLIIEVRLTFFKANDIIVPAKAILLGLKQRYASTGVPPILIHTVCLRSCEACSKTDRFLPAVWIWYVYDPIHIRP